MLSVLLTFSYTIVNPFRESQEIPTLWLFLDSDILKSIKKGLRNNLHIEQIFLQEQDIQILKSNFKSFLQVSN